MPVEGRSSNPALQFIAADEQLITVSANFFGEGQVVDCRINFNSILRRTDRTLPLQNPGVRGHPVRAGLMYRKGISKLFGKIVPIKKGRNRGPFQSG